MIPALILGGIAAVSLVKHLMKPATHKVSGTSVGYKHHPADVPMAKDLVDWAIWGDHSHKPQMDTMKQNMLRHARRGDYDPTKAPFLWRHYVDRVVPSYSKNAGGLQVSTGTKNLASKILANKFAAELNLPRHADEVGGRRLLSRAQVNKDWRNELVWQMPHIILDKPAASEAWGAYLNGLRQEGRISEHAYETWTMPAFSKAEVKEALDHAARY